MFSSQLCGLNKNALEGNEKLHNNYFSKLIVEEEKRVNDLKTHDTGVTVNTTGNPLLKAQQDDINISKELKELKKQDLLERTRRQQLRSESQELRLLQSQLRSALVVKQLTEQSEHLRKQREEDLLRKREEDALWTAEFEKAKKTTLEQEEKERQRKCSIRSALQEQIQEKHHKRKQELETVLKGREEMQKTIKHLQIEEHAKKEASRRIQEQCRQQMEVEIRNRQVQKQLEKERNLSDNERQMAYQQEREDLKNQMEKEKKRLMAEKMAVSEKIGNELAEICKEKKQREDLLLKLTIEECKAIEDDRYRRNLDRQQKERTQLRIELEKYRKEIMIQKERQFQEEERQMREEHMRQMAERDKLDQLSDQKRRHKVMEHNKSLREMIEARRRQRAEEISNRISDFEKLVSSEKQRDRLIEEERIRILQATPGELLRYLPQGVLKQSDREFLSLPKLKE